MFVKYCWAILALIHIMPALAFFRPELLTSLYGAQSSSSTYLLLQHRAALFAGIFVACLWALFRSESRQLAVVLVAISMLSFLVVFAVHGMPENLRVIAIVDLLGLPFLGIVAWHAFCNAKL